jgi:hypothetical protein
MASGTNAPTVKNPFTTRSRLKTNTFATIVVSIYALAPKNIFLFYLTITSLPNCSVTLHRATHCTLPIPKNTPTGLETKKKTGLQDAIRAGVGKMNGEDVVIACMDFNFIGGSMGSVVGEKIARSIDYSIKIRFRS